MKLKDKVAVVTGGNSGIGLAIARRFRKEGARVAILGRNAETLEKAAIEIGEGTLAVQGDVTSLADLDRFYDQVKESLGTIDVLVANSGIAPMAALEQTDEETFDKISDVNFKGAFFTVQRAVPHMENGGSVVITSSAVNVMGMQGMSVYAATKAAVRSLARSLSAELLPRGIRVNTLSPGAIETPIFDRMGIDEKGKQEFAEFINSSVPMKRFGNVEEMAGAAAFLASDDSSYMAGSDLVADGGISTI